MPQVVEPGTTLVGQYNQKDILKAIRSPVDEGKVMIVQANEYYLLTIAQYSRLFFLFEGDGVSYESGEIENYEVSPKNILDLASDRVFEELNALSCEPSFIETSLLENSNDSNVSVRRKKRKFLGIYSN